MIDRLAHTFGFSNMGDLIFRVGVWIMALLAPLYNVLGAVIILIFVDFITGIGAARKENKPIRARFMADTLGKFLFYSAVIIAAHALEVKIIPELPALKAVSGFIALTELYSIFENFNRIYGVNIIAYFRKFIQRKAPDELFSDPKEDRHEN